MKKFITGARAFIVLVVVAQRLIVWSPASERLIRMGITCGSYSDGYVRSQLIWIYTLFSKKDKSRFSRIRVK